MSEEHPKHNPSDPALPTVDFFDDFQLEDWLPLDKQMLGQLLVRGHDALYDRRLYANVFNRPLSLAELDHLFSSYPFLALKNATVEVDLSKQGVMRPLVEGWQVKDCEDWVVMGPSWASRKRRTSPDGQEDEEGGGGHNIMQSLFATRALIEQLLERWPAIEWTGGYYRLTRVAWLVCGQMGANLYGYEPNELDLRAERVLGKEYAPETTEEWLKRKAMRR